MQLSWLSGYVFQGTLRHCAIFREPGREIKLSLGFDLAENQQVFNTMVSRGFRIHRLTSYYGEDNTPRFFQLFRPNDHVPWFCYIRSSAKAFDAKNTELLKSGYLCTNLHVSSKGSATTWCGVWERANGAWDTIVKHSLTYRELCDLFYKHCGSSETNTGLGHRDEAGACAYEQDGMLRFATVFSNRALKNGLSRGHWTKYLLTRADLETQDRERAGLGYVIESINPIVFDGEERFNATWEHRGETALEKVKLYLGITSEEFQLVLTELTNGSCAITEQERGCD
jgi:hypothetical protein